METSARLLGGRYELGALLASGGMGRVWRGRDTVLNRPVAVKILRSEFTDDGAFLARFRAEAQHAAALHHPNIASVFDYGEVEEQGRAHRQSEAGSGLASLRWSGRPAKARSPWPALVQSTSTPLSASA